MNIFKKIWAAMKKTFTKNDNSKTASTTQNGSKTTTKVTGGVYSNNSDNSTINNSQTIVEQTNNYYQTANTKDAKFGLLVMARWQLNVPHKITKSAPDDFDQFTFLAPTESDYKKPLQTIQIDETEKEDMERQIYFFIEPNSNSIIYDFKIVRVEADVDIKIRKEMPASEHEIVNIKKSFHQDMPIIASIKTAYPFALQIPDVKIGTGKMIIDFGFSCDNQNYIQSFEFEINDKSLQCTSGNYFIQRKYNEPKALPKKFSMQDF